VAPERHRDGQRPPPRIDILDDAAVCEAGRSAVLIMQIHDRMIGRRTLEHQVGEKSEFVSIGHPGPGFGIRDGHERFTL
jgi:hypothetical protein